MSKFYKKALILITILLSSSLFLAMPAYADPADDLLEVSFWDGSDWKLFLPGTGSGMNKIFNEDNFLPGDSLSARIKVKNISGENQDIGVEAINFSGIDFSNSDPNEVSGKSLSRYLILKINDGNIFNNTLFNFYETGELLLISSLDDNAEEEFNFVIIYPSTEEDQDVEATIFDLLFGVFGEESNGGKNNGGGSITDSVTTSGGGSYYRGLTISGEKSEVLAGCTTALISWQTNYFSTSQVIYSSQPNQFNFSEGPEKYGYDWSEEGDTSGKEKTTFHNVELTGLNPETTYYYRCVSHASPATIGQEHSFATCSLPEEIIEEEAGEEAGPSAEEEYPAGEADEGEPAIVPTEPAIEESAAAETIPEEAGISEEEKEELEEETANNLLANLLSALGGECLECLPWWIILLISFAAFLYGYLAKRKKQRAFIGWFAWGIFLFVLSFIFYFAKYFCISFWLFVSLLFLTIFWWYLFKGRREKKNKLFILGLILLLLMVIIFILESCVYVGLIILSMFYLIALALVKDKVIKKDQT